MPRIGAKVRKAIAPVRVATTLEELKSSGAKAAWRPIHCAGFDLDEQGVKHYHHIEMLQCDCPPGPHVQALWSTAFETGEGGGRGSGKSVNTHGIVLRGNPTEWATGTPADVSYINHPQYTFLIIRKNSLDLDSWFREFRQIVEPMGATCTENPMRVRFPSGAEGSFGHLDDPEVYMKYQGKSFTRIIVEEAGQIAQETTYLKALVGSCRSAIPELHAQIWLTFNPGGPGARWINARFRFPHAGNNPWPYARPYKCKYTGRTRVLYHSTVYDNPYFLVGNAEYVKTLEMYKESDPTLYAQWLLGDFDVVPGQFFPAFRKERRITEPENAVHVIPPRLLAPWWPRAIGLDWGFSHPAGMTRACWTPERQLIVEREAKFQGKTCKEIGAEIARINYATLEALPSHHMNCYLSHDCFHVDGRATEASQIAEGINEVLGAGSVFILAPNEDEIGMDAKAQWESVQRRQRESGNRTAITLVKAGGGSKRRMGYNLARDYMRWASLTASAKFDEEYAKRLMLNDGALAYIEYKSSFDKAAAEKLPILQIFNTCPFLIGQIVATQTDPNNSEEPLKQDDDDVMDSCLEAGTQITVRGGDKAIENVAVGDEVMTRAGWKPVIASGMTNQSAQVLRVEFSDGRSLTGTRNHPVFVQGKGFTPLGDLKQGDEVECLKPSSSTERSTAATQTHRGYTSETITGPVVTIENRGLAPFIETSGNTITGTSLMGSLSITGTRTRSTTTSQTWRCFPGVSTLLSICSSLRTASVHGTWRTPTATSRKSGTLLKRVTSGISSTLRSLLENFGCLQSSSVRFAGIPSWLSQAWALSTVAINASTSFNAKRGPTSGLENAQSAVLITLASQPRNPAPVSVSQLSIQGRKAVYNLTVEKQPEYYANGVLVHNCVHIVSNFPFANEAAPRDVQIQAKLDRMGEGWGAGARELMREYHTARLAPVNTPLSIPRMAGPSSRRAN